MEQNPSTSKASGSGAGADGGGGNVDKCDIPEGYLPHLVANPQSATDMIAKLKASYEDLFVADNDYEQELLTTIRHELQRDDEIDAALAALPVKPSPAEKSCNPSGSGKQTKKPKFVAPTVEPASALIALAAQATIPSFSFVDVILIEYASQVFLKHISPRRISRIVKVCLSIDHHHLCFMMLPVIVSHTLAISSSLYLSGVSNMLTFFNMFSIIVYNCLQIRDLKYQNI